MILAVAADYEIPNIDIPVFNLNDITSIADFIGITFMSEIKPHRFEMIVLLFLGCRLDAG